MGKSNINILITLVLLIFCNSLMSQSEGGFGFRRFANIANLNATSINNSDKNASRRAYVHSTGLYYVWNGSSWEPELSIDTLSYSNDTLKISLLRDGVPAKKVRIITGDTLNLYTLSDTITDNTRKVTIKESLEFNALNTYNPGDAIPFQINVSGNEPIGQLWDFGTDSVLIQQSDTEIWLKSNANLGLVTDGYIFFQGDSVQVSNGSVPLKSTMPALVGITNIAGNPILKSIQGTETGQVLVWDEPNQYWYPDTIDGGGGGDDWGSQYVQRDSSLTGKGLVSSPLGIKGYGAAANGKVPSKSTGGITWVPIDTSVTNEGLLAIGAVYPPNTGVITTNTSGSQINLAGSNGFNIITTSTGTNGTLTFKVVPQQIDTFSLLNDTLYISLSRDSVPAKKIALTDLNVNIYNSDGTTTNRTVEVNGPIDWLDADGDGEFNVSMGDTSSQGNLFVTGIETKINHTDSDGISTVVADGSGIEISTTDPNNDNILVQASGIVELNGDSIVMDDIGLITELPTILGLTGINTVKKLDGINDGDVITWDSIASVWTSSPSSYVNIYNSNGTVGANRVASLTSNLTFSNNSAATGERFTVLFDNGISSTNYFEVKEGTGIKLQSSENNIILEGQTLLGDMLSPTTITTSQNNYAGLNGGNFGRLSSNASVTISGIDNGYSGRILPVFNVSTHAISFLDQSGSSTSENRIELPADLRLNQNDGAFFIYDSITTRWRLVGTNIGSIYTNSGRMLNGRSTNLYVQYMTDTLNDFAIGYFTNGTTDDKTTYGKFGLHMDGDGGFSAAAKETYIKGAGFNLLGTSYIAARQNYFDLYGVDRLTVGGTQNYSQLVGSPTSSYFLLDHGNTEVYNTISLGMKKDNTGIPSNRKDYGFLYQGGGMTGSDTSAISVWWGIPQISDTVSSITSGNVRAVSSNRGFGVQSLFDYNAGGVAATLKYDWLKVKMGSVASDTTSDGITFYNGSYEIPNDIPSSAAGDTSVMVWTSPTNSFFMLKSDFGGGGNNIYNSNGTTTSNTRVATILETLRFVGTADLGLDPYPLQVVSTGNEPLIQLWKGNADSVWLYQSDVEYHFGSSTHLVVESNDKLSFQADSIYASTLEAKTTVRNIIGTTPGGWLKRLDGDAASSGDILQSNGTDWVVTPLSTAISSSAFIQNGNSFAAGAVLGTNDDNSLSFETNNVTRATVTSGASTGGAWTMSNITANTNTSSDIITLQTNSTGSPSANFGQKILFRNETSTTDNTDCASIEASWLTETHATRKGQLILNTSINGAMSRIAMFSGNNTPSMRLGASGLATYTDNGISTTSNYGISSSQASASSISVTNSNVTVLGGIQLGSSSASTFTSGTKNAITIVGNYAPTSGTGLFYNMSFTPTINQTGGANGATGAIIFEPTLTSVGSKWSALTSATSNSNALFINQTGSSSYSTHVGAFGFGSTTVPTDKVEITGNLALLTAGNKLKIATGANASVGTSAAMTAGTITINTTAVTANSQIFLTHATLGGTQGILSVGTVTAGTSFVINSSSATDTGTVNWLIIN